MAEPSSATASAAPLRLAFADRRLLVCVGSGGVGKTTLAAAIGLSEARAGRKVLVCTIDPAKRLANSLGITALDNSERQIDLAAVGLAGTGQLFAMMLDLRRSWDELIDRTAKSPARRDRIYANPFYQQLSSALAGSQEYAAVAKLAELAQERDYDLIVLDTPPTVQALDFLDAPTRILDFLDNGAARFLLTPALLAGKVGFHVFSLGSGFLVKGLSRFTGLEMLQQLADFMLQLSGMYDTFKAKAQEVKRLLASPETGFLLVTAPSSGTIDEALTFAEILRSAELPLRAVIANRVNAVPEVTAAELLALGIPLPAPLSTKLAKALADATALAARDMREISRLSAAGLRPLQIPRLTREVFDLRALVEIGELLASAASSVTLSAA